MNELISCKERSVPEMADLVGSLSKRIPSPQALPWVFPTFMTWQKKWAYKYRYLWNHDEQREIIHNLNIKWEDMLLQDYLTSVLPDDVRSGYFFKRKSFKYGEAAGVSLIISFRTNPTMKCHSMINTASPRHHYQWDMGLNAINLSKYAGNFNE